MSVTAILEQDLLKFVKPDMIRLYVERIYRNAEMLDIRPDHTVEVRKLGKLRMSDNTHRMADESVTCMIQPQLIEGIEDTGWAARLADWVVTRAEKAAPSGLGTFLSPAVCTDRRATDASVEYLTTICIDLDTGDTEKKLQALVNHIGRATFVVRSGGTTDQGFPKLHIHYVLDEPCAEPWKVAYIREQLAMRVGGDLSFKRIPQIIRVPGTLYDKEGKYCTVELVEYNEDIELSIAHLEEVLDINWNALNPQSMWAQKELHANGKSKDERDARIKQVMSEEIHAGSTNEDTRFSRFTEYAGYNIRQARIGRFTVEEALDDLQSWVAHKMVPPWAPDRVLSEFKNLLGRDKMAHPDTWAERHRPIAHLLPKMTVTETVPDLKDLKPDQVVPVQYDPVVTQPAQQPAAANDEASPLQSWSIGDFDVGKLYQGEAPPERYLVENMISFNQVHALVADGGIGKTYLGLELALRMAAGKDMVDNRFLGFNVLESCVSIVLTVEDGKDDIHRRLVAIDPDASLRKAAQGSCFIVPVKEQILGGLMLVEKDARGNHIASASWKFVLQKIGEILKGRAEPAFVIIDTYSATHHGDENSTVGTVEWFRSAGMLSSYYNAAIMVMHHVRKTDPDKEIKTPSEFRQAIRGSIAFPASCRAVFGIWEMPNSDSILKELPREKGARLFNMGIVKQNGGADWSDRSDPRYPEPMITLRRLGNGKLIYDALIHEKRISITTDKKEREAADKIQLKAAIIYACRWYAENAWALTEKLMSREAEKFFPKEIHEVPAAKIKKAITELVKAGTLKEIKIKARGGTFTVYDMPEGPYTLGQQVDRAKETPVLDWSGLRYDDQNQDYTDSQNVPNFMSYGNP